MFLGTNYCFELTDVFIFNFMGTYVRTNINNNNCDQI